jgi:Protein of unknown function (DUF1559)
MSQYQMPQAPYNAPVPQKSNTLKIVLIVVAVILGLMVLGCGLLAVLLIPAISAAREAAQRQMASNNLKQIGLAFHNYESAYKRLPALHGINHENKPTGNWRISLSPFLEQTAIFNRFDFKKTWDSPENQAATSQMPALFRSPMADPNQPPNNTNVFTIQDPKSIMPGGALYKRFSEATDGTSNTIIAIDLPNHSVPWTQPNDLTIAEAIQLIRANKQPEMILALMLDGSIIRIGKLTDQELSQLFTINDGAIVPVPDPF